MSPPGTARFSALGTTAVLLSCPPSAGKAALGVLRDELQAIDAACSRFRPDAELAGLNRAGGRWQEVSPLLLEAVEVALAAARQSAGAVDPTVGRALRLLGYNQDFAQIAPDGPPLEITLGPVPGWQAIEVDHVSGRIRVPAGVEVDLGATAKALAADRAAGRAAAVTGAGVLVGLGGDIAMAGPAPAEGWEVRVTDDHRAPPGAPGQTVRASAGGLATSSIAVRAWRRGDEILHHVVDPGTGRPATGPWRTASVAAATCVAANTAATAALVLGTGAAPWLEDLGLPARLVDNGGAVRTVAGWPPERS
ncbi:MAG: FAD:protein FMN transferase [Acidimicrobiales bacterium]